MEVVEYIAFNAFLKVNVFHSQINFNDKEDTYKRGIIINKVDIGNKLGVKVTDIFYVLCDVFFSIIFFFSPPLILLHRNHFLLPLHHIRIHTLLVPHPLNPHLPLFLYVLPIKIQLNEFVSRFLKFFSLKSNCVHHVISINVVASLYTTGRACFISKIFICSLLEFKTLKNIFSLPKGVRLELLFFPVVSKNHFPGSLFSFLLL